VTVEKAVPAWLRSRTRPRLFYGWWIVVGAVVAQFVAIGMQAPVAGAFPSQPLLRARSTLPESGGS